MSAAASTPTASPLALPDFRRLWFGQAMISLSVQFYTIAFVWLVLQTTGSGVALGAVLTVAAVPRAAAMLVSGVLVDRVGPRLLIAISAFSSALLVGAVAALLLGDTLSLVHVFVLAAGLGLADAFIYPSLMSLTPRLVAAPQLGPANAFLQGTDAIVNVVGPALAGLIVGQLGVAAALVLNAGFYVLGGALVSSIRVRRPTPPDGSGESFGQALRSGFGYAWRQLPVRLSLLIVGMLNFAVLGPVIVGGAVLVEARFGGDASMFGLLSACFGAGGLVGTLLGGRLHSGGSPARLMAALSAGVGAFLVGVGFAATFWVAAALLAAMGVCFGIVYIRAVTWLQTRTEPHMQGRMASLLVFAAVALDPLSNAVSGVLTDVSLTGLFVGAGVFMLGAATLVLTSRALKEA